MPPGGQKDDALFSLNSSPCDVSLPVYVFLSLMLKSPLLSFSSPARAEETLTALTSSLVAPLKLHFLFPECSCEVMWSVWRLMNEPRYQLCDNYLHNTSTTPTQRCRYGRLVCFNASKWHCKVTVKRLRTVHILFCMTDALKRAQYEQK